MLLGFGTFLLLIAILCFVTVSITSMTSIQKIAVILAGIICSVLGLFFIYVKLFRVKDDANRIETSTNLN